MQMVPRSSSLRSILLIFLVSLLPVSEAFFFGNGCGCQLSLPTPPPLPQLDSCACRKEERDQPVFREPPTLPFMPLQQSSIYYAPPPAANPTYYSAPGPVIAREYIPVSSYQTSPTGFQSGTFPIGQDSWSGNSYMTQSQRRPNFAFQRANDRMNRYTTSSYVLPPFNPPLSPPPLPPPIVLPPTFPSWPSLPPPPTPPPADFPDWVTQPPPPPPPRVTLPPADWPAWTTQPPPPPPPRVTLPPADWPAWTTQPPPPPPPPTVRPTTTPPPADFPTAPPPPPPTPPPTNPYKPWNPYTNNNDYKPTSQVYSVNDIVVDVMRPPPSLSRFPPGFQDEVAEFRKKKLRKHKKA